MLYSYLLEDPLMSKFFDPFIFEYVPAKSKSAESVFLHEVEICDIYLGIFGNEYGSRKKAGVSPTEQEYNKAHELHKDCLIYIKRELLIEILN